MRLVIRIVREVGDAIDWTVSSENVTFRETLEVIAQVYERTEAYAFEYEDEDGDRITVRSQEEMQNMISSHLDLTGALSDFGNAAQPLVIYPRVGKAPGKRNIMGLKVQTNEDLETSSNHSSPHLKDSGSQKQQGHDIQEILAMGNVRDADLQYLEKLGCGQAGSVFKARHVNGGNTLAVKIIQLDVPIETQRQIISELEILNRCKSEAIIGFYGAFFNDNKIFMCTEYMDGGSLERYGKIEEPVLGRIAARVIHGLQYLWTMKILHRDVKPSNILVNSLGFVKLCDFSVSVQLVHSIAKTYIGTNAYMAPERVRGEDYGVPSEVWSLGVTLYELSLGKFPYDSVKNDKASPMDIINSIVNTPPPPLPRDIFSEELVHFVTNCMEPRTERRLTLDILSEHPWIITYTDADTSFVAEWLQNRLLQLGITLC